MTDGDDDQAGPTPRQRKIIHVEHFGNCDVCGALVDMRDLAQVTATCIGLAYARAFGSAGPTWCSTGMGAPAEVEKEQSAIKNDLEVKSIYSPAESNAAAWRRKQTSARP